MATTYGFFWPRSFPVPNWQLETVLPEVILAQKPSVMELDLMIDVIWMSSRITGGDGNELSRHLSGDFATSGKHTGVLESVTKPIIPVLTKIARKKVNRKSLKNLYTSRTSTYFSKDQVRKKVPCFWYQNEGDFMNR
jgi:hypothetical protein